jgi:hypothetical protein
MKPRMRQLLVVKNWLNKRQSGVTNSRVFRLFFGLERMYRSTGLGVFINARKHLADTRRGWHQKCEPMLDLRPRNSPKSDCLF